MEVNNLFRYVDASSRIEIKDAFVSVLPVNIDSKDVLLESLALKLAFPDYFGFNWDALFDCLRDFSWIEERDILLVHQELPKLSSEELKVYLRLLRDAILDWRPGEAHRFGVVFSLVDKESVERLLRDG